MESASSESWGWKVENRCLHKGKLRYSYQKGDEIRPGKSIDVCLTQMLGNVGRQLETYLDTEM